MTTADRIRRAAKGARPTADLSDLLGYFSKAWVLVQARLPITMPMVHWGMATDTERRMFLLMVAEALDGEEK